jgi:hypothetical protein
MGKHPPDLKKIRQAGVNLIKLFCGIQITYSFGNLDLFTTMQQILLTFIKWSSLQISVSDVVPK